ncbi:site-specific integrase [Methylomonas sp. ZR1]|uniref:site-specific integrase n=1 Tax=Methylomonas sp. ZR1 TaxID=1797072 RepID=UPI0014918C66|nr:site-specific integrase [Methylomonas sp. ZR1]NOV29575.1 Tn3 family resolvase [Methylomonas sp. ZR1]
MNRVDQYLNAAERANTRRSYDSAIRHFEIEWGGLLPSSVDNVARYLAEHAESLSLNTLKHRLAALSRWHQDHGFTDPTKAPKIRQVIKGIRAIHPSREKRAKPLELDILQRICEWLTHAESVATTRGDKSGALRHARDRALVLLGFWRGFRADELAGLRIEFIEITPGEGLTCFLPRSKGDRQLDGRNYSCPALSRLCAVEAVAHWLDLSGLKEGPLYRKIDRWGQLAETGLAPGSIIPLLRKLLAQAGIANAEEFSSHSLRRGFANWARLSGWDIRELMNYVGWGDVKSAMRYLDGADESLKERFERGMNRILPHPDNPTPQKSVPQMPPAPETALTTIEVLLQLSPYTGNSRRKRLALRDMTTSCLARFQAQQIDRDGYLYQLSVPSSSTDILDDHLYALLDELHQIADARQCVLEAVCRDPASGKHWD